MSFYPTVLLPYGFGLKKVSSWLKKTVSRSRHETKQEVAEEMSDEKKWVPFTKYDVWHHVDFIHVRESFTRVVMPP